ncbi:hypothetical protein [Roseisolibacter sp. H3M3-2]|uniref:hypothetical protein n=1 Tax=Roseisolibacter sp. H3M3-2 TaxID=3031323 RepID=UPI0023DCB3AC|nr:hypothetical protein [Roseisolibacter sp. H3M3-2]MDF1502143.1 hypothetical protein [Roseisolibacter sp. H3M3-2]
MANPAVFEQFVLVERTLSGRVTVTDPDVASDPFDPIRSGGGVPVTGARVEVTDATGATAVAVESQTGTPLRGTGVYRFGNVAAGPNFPGGRAGVRVAPGARLTLRVVTQEGTVVQGATTVPGGAGTPFAPPARTRNFLRDRDTLRLQWDPVPGARSYLVRVESPYGAFFLFTDSASATLTGELRNVFADRLPRVFQAGFTQWVNVAAVDTNFFDYYRSTNSPFTGSGLINRLDGGIGVFGAYVPVQSIALSVRATDRDPFDGRYVSAGPQGPEALRLWVDARANGLAEVTGAYRLPTAEQYGVLGTLEGTRLRLRAVDAGDSRVADRVMEGEVRGDTILVQLRGALLAGDDGRRRFVRDTTPIPGEQPPR